MKSTKHHSHGLVPLSLSAILLASANLLAMSPTEPLYVYGGSGRSYNVSKLPVLANTGSFPILSAQGVYALDLSSGVVLYEKNADMHLLPASTTKMMTALVALENYSQADVVNTGAFRVVGASMGLSWHEEIAVEDLLYGLLVHSGNDAAEVLANNFPGGRSEFIKQMNLKARALRANDTRFLNPSGLDAPGQVTTAKDLARIAMYAMKNKDFAKIVSTESYVARDTSGALVHYLNNRNQLLGTVDGVLGIKTGWTENARENLVTYVERDGRKVMLALLGSQDRFGESKELIEWIFDSYQWTDISYSPQVPHHSTLSK